MTSRALPSAILGLLTTLAACTNNDPSDDEVAEESESESGESGESESESGETETSETETETETSEETSEETGEEPTWPMVESELAHDEDPQATADEQLALAADNHALSLDLYHDLREGKQTDKGFTVSAYSIQSAFGMLYGGTVEPAATEMATTLHLSLPGERQHVALNWLDKELNSRNLPEVLGAEPMDPVIFEAANGVWALPGVATEILPEYLDLLAVHYGTGVALADFTVEYEQERMDINLWVSNRTHTLIPEFFKEGVINDSTRMVLVNAIYLKAPWAAPFDERATSKADFTRLDGSVVQVDMMSNGDLSGGYGEGVGYRVLVLPLRGSQLELVAVVPDDFAAFEAELDAAKLDEVVASVDYGRVVTEFPRFELDMDISLKSNLETLGLHLPFEDGNSFEGIMPGGPGVITDVIHHTVVKVDEKGTEAAAATGIVLGGDEGPEPEYSITVDRPFVLLLRDEPTNTLLFFGRVLDPSA
jgi:serpin B